jgi:LacI family transcriptional regulator
MYTGQVTIRHLAKELGVSCSTISRALKDHPGISHETKKAVVDLAKKWNYKPNAVALSLRKSKTNIIGVIIPEIVHFFFSTVISGIEDVAYSKGYNVMVCQSNENFEREVTDTDALISSRVDGLLVAISRDTTDLSHLEELIENNVPLVFFDRLPHEQPVSSVIVDDKHGAFKATEHLIEQGCRRIAHLAGPQHLLLSRKRVEGYKAALIKHGVEFDERLILPCPIGSNTEAKEITAKAIKDMPDLDGIFAHNDVAAFGAMSAIKEKGLKIPNDIGVVGFSNWQFSSLIEPGLSSVSQPGFEMGQEAARMLIEQIEYTGKSTIPPLTTILNTELIIRGTSQKKSRV